MYIVAESLPWVYLMCSVPLLRKKVWHKMNKIENEKKAFGLVLAITEGFREEGFWKGLLG